MEESTLPSRPLDDKEQHQKRDKDTQSSSDVPPASPASKHTGNEPPPTVRFSSAVDEIPRPTPFPTKESYGTGTPGQLCALSNLSLQASQLQERRINMRSFEPFSLPTSRVGSHEDSSREASRQPSRSSTVHQSPLLGSKAAEMQSPPLTPAGTGPGEAEAKAPNEEHTKRPSPAPHVITPQESTQDPNSPSASSSPGLPRRAKSSDHVPQRRQSEEERESNARSHRKSMFTVGPGGSVPTSRESSPTRASQLYTRPLTPAGDQNDPYAANRRQPQSKIEPRFVFSRKKKASPSSSTTSLVKEPRDKRHSALLGLGKKDHYGSELHEEPSQTPTLNSRPGSLVNLKRYFKIGEHKGKRSHSPSGRSSLQAPPSGKPTQTHRVPFGDDHGLATKYGKIGRVLGSGAGGSVRLMKRQEDGTVFAVKEFRAKHTYETEREYVKKLTAEYCIGSSLHHGNIIETLDIVQERGKWYEVMEYAPYDLFAIVMTGKMSREEISCCFLQILSGVTYLHSVGLAHRDLKLDNVVVSEHGIMKIIDFGSAHVFQYPYESGLQKASGIVGSDPYLAPEVYDERKYDPRGVDIWSLAIIFCCMSLRRFPWKVPRMTDNSFKLFAAEPSPGHDPKKLISPPSRSTNDLTGLPNRDIFPIDDEKEKEKEQKHHSTAETPKAQTPDGQPAEKREVIRGPWRILRLLPRETRHIIGRMLEIDPKKRANMSEIMEDGWVANTVICSQTAPGEVVNAEGHIHHLEPPSSK